MDDMDDVRSATHVLQWNHLPRPEETMQNCVHPHQTDRMVPSGNLT